MAVFKVACPNYPFALLKGDFHLAQGKGRGWSPSVLMWVCGFGKHTHRPNVITDLWPKGEGGGLGCML